jgi:hypothetical protein
MMPEQMFKIKRIDDIKVFDEEICLTTKGGFNGVWVKTRIRLSFDDNSIEVAIPIPRDILIELAKQERKVEWE